MTVDERPYAFNWSKNEIRYLFTLDDLTRPGLHLQVKIMYNKGAGDKELIILPLFPFADGKTALYLDDYLDGILTYTKPVLGSSSTHAGDQYADFWIEYREVTNSDADPDWVIDSANKKKVIKGGIDREKHARNNSFINYFEPLKKFLSWQPNGCYIFPDQQTFITFFNYQGLTDYAIFIDVYRVDGSSLNDSLPLPITAGELITHISVNKIVEEAIGAALPYTPAIHYITLKIIRAGSEESEIKKFFYNYRPCYDYTFYDLLLFNSLSGVDSFRVRGEQVKGFERTAEEAGGGISTSEWTDDYKSHQARHASIVISKKRTGDLGFLPSRAHQEACMEIHYSKAIYELIDSRYIPILINAQTFELNKSTDKKHSFALEWKSSISNESFTPEGIVFGAGSL